MLTPNQFRVNEAWIAIRVNEAFLFVKDWSLRKNRAFI